MRPLKSAVPVVTVLEPAFCLEAVKSGSAVVTVLEPALCLEAAQIQRIVCLVGGRTDKTSQLALTAWRRSRRPRKGAGKPLLLCQAAAFVHGYADDNQAK